MTTRYISSWNTLLSLKVCVIAGLKCYFCWIYKTLLLLQSYFLTPLTLVSTIRFLCFVSGVQSSLISPGLILPCFAQLSAPNVFASCLLLLQPRFKCPFQEEKPACLSCSKKKRSCSELEEWITIPSFMLVTLKGIKIEGFQGRKIPITKLQMLQMLVSLWAKDVWKQIFLLTNTPVTVLKKIRSVTSSAHLWMCIASKFRVF